MTESEYLEKLDVLESRYKKRKYNLAEEYALSNNPYNIGDIIRDTTDIIEIENVFHTIGIGNVIPTCYYTGVELTKKLQPKIKQTGVKIFQNNVIKKLN